MDRLALAAAVIVTALAYVLAYPKDPAVHTSPAWPQWWGWTDQGRYLRATLAWAAGDLRPDQHWYPAGFALLAAPFVHLIPSNPFYAVDLVCLVAAAALTVVLGGRLAPGSAWSRPAAAIAFCLAVPFNTLQLRAYIEPWTTTPVVPLTLAAFVLTLRMWDRPDPRRAVAAGLALGAIVLFRPTDALPPLLMLGLTSIGRVRLPSMLAAAAGVALPVAIFATIHLAIFGIARGDYLASASATGFEWRLLPYRWVTLMVSSAPDWPGLVSLSQAFPVFFLGAAGTLACLVATSGRQRRAHVAVAGSIWLHIAVFLCYRDLHAKGLFQFGNYHYFKSCVPVLALYSWFLLAVLAPTRRRGAAWAIGFAGAAFAFSWRVGWALGPAVPATIDGPTLHLTRLPTIGNGFYVPAKGDDLTIYFGGELLEAGDRLFAGNENFKLVPWQDGFLLLGLRPLPPGPATLHVAQGIRLRNPVLEAQAQYTLRAPNLPGILQKFGHLWW